MAFNATNLQLYTTQYNLNSLSSIPKLWGYATSVDDIAVVSANGYFDPFANFALNTQAPGAFAVGDQINCSCSDGNIGLQVIQITPIVETLPFIQSGTVTTTDIANQAVTAAKIANGTITTTQISSSAAITGSQLSASANIAGSQLAASAGIVGTQLTAGTLTNTQINASAAIAFSKLAALSSGNILVGNGSNVAASVAMSGDATISNAGVITIGAGAVSSSKLAASTIQYVKVPMTAAQFKGMYAAPFELISAPGSGLAIIVKQVAMSMTFVSASYASGGAVICQYDVTQTEGSGINACGTGTVPSADVNGFGASATFGLVGQIPIVGVANSTFVNKDVCLSNASNAFTTGDGTWEVHVWYSIVTL